MNALKHGLAARDIVIGDEDPQQFEALRDGLEAYFRPVGAMESELVDRVGGLLWRLRRVPAAESALIRGLQEERERSELMRSFSIADIESLEDGLMHLRCKIAAEDGNVLSAFKDGTYAERVKTYGKERKAKEERIRSEPPIDQPMDLYVEGVETGLMLLLKNPDGNETLGKLSRYETSLMNTLTRTLNLLHFFQGARKSGENDERVVDGIAERHPKRLTSPEV